ncbi:MAG: DUF3598 family protein [Burkholderiales bacterium]
MTIADILRSMYGVWHGTYTVMAPDGSRIEHFASQQEGRMEGTDWTEKVIYRKGDGKTETSYFHAVVDGDAVTFDNDTMWGSTCRAGNVAIVFTFGWKDRPRERIVEVSMPKGDYRTRLWQHFEDDRLTRLTVIEERREPGREPERWYRGPSSP